jgi:hypothetical protein
MAENRIASSTALVISPLTLVLSPKSTPPDRITRREPRCFTLSSNSQRQNDLPSWRVLKIATNIACSIPILEPKNGDVLDHQATITLGEIGKGSILKMRPVIVFGNITQERWGLL